VLHCGLVRDSFRTEPYIGHNALRGLKKVKNHITGKRSICCRHLRHHNDENAITSTHREQSILEISLSCMQMKVSDEALIVSVSCRYVSAVMMHVSSPMFKDELKRCLITSSS
jgi:hypothetical protein